MENLICSAYTYIEFNKSFEKYYSSSKGFDNESKALLRSRWKSIRADYKIVSAYLTDDAIIQTQNLAISEF